MAKESNISALSMGFRKEILKLANEAVFVLKIIVAKLDTLIAAQEPGGDPSKIDEVFTKIHDHLERLAAQKNALKEAIDQNK